jgi:3-oxoacyl-(acyl-carrier-protein) synthase
LIASVTTNTFSGKIDLEHNEKVTAIICQALSEVGISADRIYVNFHGTEYFTQ